MNNLPSTNGNGKKTAQTLPDTRIQAAELFISNFQAREHELENVKADLAEARITIRELEAELEAMKRERVMLESRATSCLLQRDEAKDHQVRLATIINAAQRLFLDAGVPTLADQAEAKAQAEEGTTDDNRDH
jgi:septal ring factor EnvC (AmiA/AmiB activator)